MRKNHSPVPPAEEKPSVPLEVRMFKSLTALSLALCIVSPCLAAQLTVPAEYATIGAALAAAVSGDEVLVSCGVYYEHDLVMKSGVSLVSETAGAYCTTIDAQNLGRVLVFQNLSSTATVRGFTLRNGQAPAGQMGGGAYVINSSPYFVNCIFLGNTSVGQPGGGVAVINAGTPFFEFCTFSWNSATGTGGWGGGLYIHNSSPQLVDCTVRGNTSGEFGGGIYATGSTFTITYCRFTENQSASAGGALYLANNSPVMCTLSNFFGNYAAAAGGAIYSIDSSPVIMSCTIVENSTSGNGAGLYTAGTGVSAFDSSIIAFSNLAGAAYIAGGSALFTCCDIYGNAGGDWTGSIAAQEGVNGNFSADPEFCGVNSSGNYFLQGDSPCAPANNGCGLVIGANSVDCGFIATEETSFSKIKSMY